MKVLLISASYHPVLGGLQTVTHQLACSLKKNGHDVRVLTNRYPRALPEQEILDGVPVERWTFLDSFGDAAGNGRLDLALASAYFRPAVRARLARLLDRFRPDVVNLHFPEPRLACVMDARRRSSFRLVVSLHGDEVERWFRPQASSAAGRPGFEQMREFLRCADSVTACSGYLLDRAMQLEPSLAGKSRVIYNGVDQSRFRDSTAHVHGRPYILAYGRHTFKKGFDLLLEAFAGVARRRPEVDLILAGDGEQREELTRLCGSLGLNDRVVFYGRARPDEVVRLLNGCRLAVIPSRQEPFGIGERSDGKRFQLTGRPLVVTRVGGLPELIARLASAIGPECPPVRWAEPESQALEPAILAALSGPEGVARPQSLPGFSIADMASAYQQVLDQKVLEGARALEETDDGHAQSIAC